MKKKGYYHRKKHIVRILMAVSMICIMTASVITPTFAATARATTMKLEKTEGQVTLKTQNGSVRKITNGMRLLNGHTLATAKASYAYINLDNSKAVKLDQNSSATLRQNGKSLELLVKDGSLFFNVSKPLTGKENMNIRTSTMVTGIRGTCGVVEKISQRRSKLHLLEGQVTLGTGSNATTIYGGQTATVILQSKQESGDPDQPGGTDKPGDTDKPEKDVIQKILVDTLTEENVPTFAIEEIINNPTLQGKIEKTTDLKIKKLEEILEEIKKAEEEKQEEEKQEEEKQEEEQKTEETMTPSGGSSLGGSSSTPGTPNSTSTTLSGIVSAAAINAALTANSTVTVGAGTDDAATEMILEADVTIPAGKTLIVEYSEVTGSGQIVVGAGTLVDKGGTLSSQIKDGNTSLLLYVGGNKVYAAELNAQVAAYLNQLAQTDPVTADFETDALVKSNISLSGSPSEMVLNMGTHTLTLESGTLTLNANVGIIGSGSATVRLNGGNLIMQGSSTSANAAIKNENGGYAIACTNGAVKWTDKGMRIVASGAVNNSVSNAIQGATLKQDELTAILPSYVTIADGGLEWNTQGSGMLAYLPSEFDSPSVLISVLRINAALQAYPTVTVSAACSMNVEGVPVRIPAGKTLNISSKATESGSDQYSGGFAIVEGSGIVLENGATLHVSGMIYGQGTIENASSGSTAKINVDNGGTIMANTIQLKGGSIENAGVIDVGTMSAIGSGTIQNSKLIKTQSYTGTGYTYSGTNGSVLICNTDLTSNLYKTSLLVTATASGSDMATQQYFYATELNSLMAQRINDITTTAGGDFKEKGASLWAFAKDAVVNSAITIDFAGADVKMGAHQMTIAAEGVTLNNIGNMTGRGKAVIYLTGAGSLTLGGSVKGTISNINEAEPYYALAASDDILKSQETHLFWANENLTISSVGSNDDPSNQHIIQGCSTGENGNIISPGWLKCQEGYSVDVKSGTANLSIIGS